MLTLSEYNYCVNLPVTLIMIGHTINMNVNSNFIDYIINVYITRYVVGDVAGQGRCTTRSPGLRERCDDLCTCQTGELNMYYIYF